MPLELISFAIRLGSAADCELTTVVLGLPLLKQVVTDGAGHVGLGGSQLFPQRLHLRLKCPAFALGGSSLEFSRALLLGNRGPFASLMQFAH